MVYIKKLSIKILAGLLGLLLLYYLIKHAFPKFILTEENYGHFWPLANLLFPHIVFATIAILLGPFQFIPNFRNRHLKKHRLIGKIYIISVVISGICAMIISATKPEVKSGDIAIFSLGFVWITTSIMALLSIKKRKIEIHKEWMIRSYAVTSSFVTLRFSIEILVLLNVPITHEILTTIGWLSWIVPLFFAELLMQGRKLQK